MDSHHEQKAAQPDSVLVTQARGAEGDADDLGPVGGIVIVGRFLFQRIRHARFILQLGLGGKQHLQRFAVRHPAGLVVGLNALFGRRHRGFRRHLRARRRRWPIEVREAVRRLANLCNCQG